MHLTNSRYTSNSSTDLTFLKTLPSCGNALQIEAGLCWALLEYRPMISSIICDTELFLNLKRKKGGKSVRNLLRNFLKMSLFDYTSK